ncbi:MAG: IreB family regulatory phosphoprotein [Clostridia bacterium]|jgi:uncharacterized protein (UPF0297 family)|nr:IreB family regulatory phosphoprotein [Clostridia bacterium]
MENTLYYKNSEGENNLAKEILKDVYKALEEKGYNPVTQLSGFILSGDPTYITSHNNARTLIMKVDREEIIEELVKAYMK